MMAERAKNGLNHPPQRIEFFVGSVEARDIAFIKHYQCRILNMIAAGVGIVTAIDIEQRATDIAGLRAQHKADYLGYFLRLSQAL